MGEAGPEAVLPLKRLGNGRLGVEAQGGGASVFAPTVNVAVTSHGKSEEEDTALGRQVADETRRQIEALWADRARAEMRVGGVLNPVMGGARS